MKPFVAVLLLLGLLLAALFLAFRWNNGLSDIVVINATSSTLTSVRLSLVDRSCDLGVLSVGAGGRCVGRATQGEGEVRVELTWATGRRATLETTRYVNPNFGWSGLLVIDNLEPPHAISSSTDEMRPNEAL